MYILIMLTAIILFLYGYSIGTPKDQPSTPELHTPHKAARTAFRHPNKRYLIGNTTKE